MQTSSSYRQILYVSQLASTQGYEAFTSICRVSRVRNAPLSVTGILLFDGQRFCQLLQGPAPAIESLIGRITHDQRHEKLRTLFDGLTEAASIEPHWQSGFCETDELDVFDDPDSLSGDAAMTAFRGIVTRSDLER